MCSNTRQEEHVLYSGVGGISFKKYCTNTKVNHLARGSSLHTRLADWVVMTEGKRVEDGSMQAPLFHNPRRSLEADCCSIRTPRHFHTLGLHPS